MKIRSVLILTAFASLTACSSIPPVNHDIPSAIANASTAGDHALLAEYFDRKAVEYSAEAERHERMQKAYTGNPKSIPGAMPMHCRSLRAKFLEAARESSALAEEHRKLGAAIR
jgi:hypothetical protein